MGMDESWHAVYERNAAKELPHHIMSCWDEEDFSMLFGATKKIIGSLEKKNILETGTGKEKLKTALDLGCGPGAYCKMLQDRGYDVTGADYSEATINVTRKNYPGIKFLVEDGYDLPFEDRSFYIVLSIGALQCVYEYEKFLSEMARVAGKFIIISTIHRRKKVEDPQALVEKQLESDTWPTRDFHPGEIIEFFGKKGFSARAVRKIGNKTLGDHFFVVAERK
jgi:ubiquinone/menaquinone biosynthesis C-methylase UbiE